MSSAAPTPPKSGIGEEDVSCGWFVGYDSVYDQDIRLHNITKGITIERVDTTITRPLGYRTHRHEEIR